ncbi:MAG: HAD family phosphatase [Lachnospiraceae bacterium]|nr:HAD family phosphatase [Lachnospiraceae bacterium]
MHKAVIFDLDGVIIDSEIFYCNRIYQFLHKKGFPISKETSWKFSGLSLAKGKALMMELIDSPDGGTLWQEYSDYIIQHPLDYQSIAAPGIYELLQTLRKHNIKIGLASSGRKKSVLNVLKELDIFEYFDVVVTGNDVKEAKPNPEIYYLAADSLSVSPKDCIVIEDSAPGITAGKDAGTFVIAKEEKRFGYSQDHADTICHDMYEIKQFILNKLKC